MFNLGKSKCETCPVARTWNPYGEDIRGREFLVALAGNPNTGKSTLFNELTGLRQHTGNWPGKTVARAEGAFQYKEKGYRLVDLPGTYSLLSTSTDETIARDFILFSKPDATVIVCDATALERNLNLVLQIRQITGKALVALNLMDEARAHGIEVDVESLQARLGVPVIPMSARSGVGIDALLEALRDLCEKEHFSMPLGFSIENTAIQSRIGELSEALREEFPHVRAVDWVALRLLEGDRSIQDALLAGKLGEISRERVDEVPSDKEAAEKLLKRAEALRWQLPPNFHDEVVEDIYGKAAVMADSCQKRNGITWRVRLQRQLDHWLTHPLTGFPLMVFVLGVVLWLTVTGANYPSSFLSYILLDTVHPWLQELAGSLQLPSWLGGLLVDGCYLTVAWVVAVMLPPMAIFFPLFTLLEDFGYLPRVAFNLDRVFEKSGAHGKQALTMAMGFGCNAAGVIAARIIDSPREKLVAILTNNFALCNGRWPTQILLATIFLGAMVPAAFSGLVATASVMAVAMLGVGLTFAVSWALSKTLLKGEASMVTLELPPYRPPLFWKTLYKSMIDRTLFVLWRAVMFALPAGAVIWLVCNIPFGDGNVAAWAIGVLDPFAIPLGLTGVILLAYIVAIPANEIVIPTVLMLTVVTTGVSIEGASGAGVMFETSDASALANLLHAGGWTTVTAVCLMLFSLCHNPCSTTLYTIYKETGSWKWTVWSAVIPTVIGVVLCFAVYQSCRLLGWA